VFRHVKPACRKNYRTTPDPTLHTERNINVPRKSRQTTIRPIGSHHNKLAIKASWTLPPISELHRGRKNPIQNYHVERTNHADNIMDRLWINQSTPHGNRSPKAPCHTCCLSPGLRVGNIYPTKRQGFPNGRVADAASSN